MNVRILRLVTAPRFAAAALALAAGLAFARGPAYEEPGPYSATTRDERWFDARRDREVPLRMRLPDAPGPRPVVLFSHGLGGSIEGGRYWGEHWASHGFVVIHVQHPGSDEAVWKDSHRPGRSLRIAASAVQLLNRAEDVKFVLDELERRAGAGDAMARRIDRQRIGLSGHSFGAVTTQAIAGQDHGAAARGHELADRRPRAFIAFSPSARNRSAARQFASIDRPFFSVTGTADGRVGLGLGVPPELRVLPFAAMPSGDKYLLNLYAADHMIFNGGPRMRGEKGDPGRDALHVRLTRATTTAFWLAYLADDGDARSWLANAADYVGDAGEFRSK